MIHHSASPQPRPAGRGLPRIRRWATGLAVAAIASLAGAPAALAGILPPPGGAVTDPVPPPPPPSPPAAAHLPLWAVVTIVAATIVLSVGTTLITLAVEHRRRGRRTPAAADPQAGMQLPSATAEPPAGQGEILSSHQHPAGYDMHRADSR
jgi:hypothetical protein